MRLNRSLAITPLVWTLVLAGCGSSGDDVGPSDDGGGDVSELDTGTVTDSARHDTSDATADTGAIDTGTDTSTRDSTTVDIGADTHDAADAASDTVDAADATDAAPTALDIQHVLLLSIDGLHETDLANFIASHPTSTLAKLAKNGIEYTNAAVNALDGSPSNPSDSFPGLLALTTGGSSPTHGVWYDASFAHELYADSACTTQGTNVTYDESIDKNNAGLFGDTASGTAPTHQAAVVRSRIDATKLPYRKTLSGCSSVLPHEFLRVNTIFEVAHAAGLHTAWSDKHLAYELVTGPSGAGVDDLFVPEINSAATNLPGTGAAAGEDFTTKAAYTAAYDDYKVQAILNQVDGKWSDDGLAGATDVSGSPGVPAIFGMNFQAVSVAQKDAKVGPGGYSDAVGTPSAELLTALEHTDASLGKLVAELNAKGLSASTLIVVTAKHGQSPIDNTLLKRRSGSGVAAIVDAVAPLAGHTEDDVGLYWLKDHGKATLGATALTSAPADGSVNDPSVDKVFTIGSTGFAAMFGDPSIDPHAPDIVVQPKKGTIYSTSAKKWAEHGGFADDDAHVALLVSNPAIAGAKNTNPVRTKQVAPTVLHALGLDATALQAVQKEGTAELPGLSFAKTPTWTPMRWTASAAPTPVTISGGPWSLAQLAPGTPTPPPVGTTLTNVSYGYCASGARTLNPGVASMQPYYFPMIIGSGSNLQGFFDWRPKDINESIVAAKSNDGGKTWTFQQEALELTTACPADVTKTNPDTTQADNGFGHPYLIEVGGVARLYALDRSAASIDNLGLLVHPLTKTKTELEGLVASPLAPMPAVGPAGGAGITRTVGLLNPDGILGVVPGSSPVQVLYVQKLKGADNTGSTALPTTQQCGAQPYLQPGATKAKTANHDIVTIRLASTIDGVSFTDLGAVSGLNDSTSVSNLGTRWVAPNGTIVKLDAAHYGLFFAGGNCIDADSDAFHYIGYAESTDLKNWTIVNGITNPIASLVTIVLPGAGGDATAIPWQYPVTGPALDWHQSRTYAPSIVKIDATHVALTFAGYGVQSPNSDLLHYRQIGNVALTASRALP